MLNNRITYHAISTKNKIQEDTKHLLNYPIVVRSLISGGKRFDNFRTLTTGEKKLYFESVLFSKNSRMSNVILSLGKALMLYNYK